MLSLIPKQLMQRLSGRFLPRQIYEFRLRRGKNVVINYGGIYTDTGELCQDCYIEEVILRASSHSVYSVSSQLKSGYIAARGGVRIGVCGYAADDGGGIVTIRDISSLNVRIPHAVTGCADRVCAVCFADAPGNMLIISPPGAGKTTLIRDMCRALTASFGCINILVIDERGEISGRGAGFNGFDIGNSDVLINTDKAWGFKNGIRSMRPDIIVCDELMGDSDFEALRNAMSCGVKVIATVHADGIEDLRAKNNFSRTLKSRYFDWYVVLSLFPRTGTVSAVYDRDFLCMTGSL